MPPSSVSCGTHALIAITEHVQLKRLPAAPREARTIAVTAATKPETIVALPYETCVSFYGPTALSKRFGLAQFHLIVLFVWGWSAEEYGPGSLYHYYASMQSRE